MPLEDQTVVPIKVNGYQSQSYSQRMTPSFNPFWKLSPMGIPVTSSIQERSSSSLSGSYFWAIWKMKEHIIRLHYKNILENVYVKAALIAVRDTLITPTKMPCLRTTGSLFFQLFQNNLILPPSIIKATSVFFFFLQSHNGDLGKKVSFVSKLHRPG